MGDIIVLDLVSLSEQDLQLLSDCCNVKPAVILQQRTRKRLLAFIRQHSARDPIICRELRVMRKIFLPQIAYRIEHGSAPPKGWMEKHFGSI